MPDAEAAYLRRSSCYACRELARRLLAIEFEVSHCQPLDRSAAKAGLDREPPQQRTVRPGQRPHDLGIRHRLTVLLRAPTATCQASHSLAG